MKAADLQNPIFSDERKAREWLEARVWADGRTCPHCGAVEERTSKLVGKAHRPGLYQCNECREQFTVTVKTLFERSKIPLTKWLLAIYLLSASKKGMSAVQLSKMLGVSYKSTWFMMHRVRDAMRDGRDPLGGPGKVVETARASIPSLEPSSPPIAPSATKMASMSATASTTRTRWRIISPS